MQRLTIKNIKKTFGNTLAVDNVSFTIEEGTFFTFLGPSGCGKTTLLRSIAGFVKPEKGSIFLGDKDISSVPAENREVGMVFQNYALFPHMNVFENVAYGLKVKRMNKKEIEKKVGQSLSLVRLGGYEKRKVSELSGGEQQRVALARSLVIEPKILLLDEPLCNLDAKLRDEMRIEIKELQNKLGITTIFVTHDQKEALTMSHKIAVFNKGKCIQIGTPREIYSKPQNSFVATFVGDINIFPIEEYWSKEGKIKTVTVEDIELEIQGKEEGTYISIRPEHIIMRREERKAVNEFSALVKKAQFSGNISEYIVNVQGCNFKISKVNDFFEDVDFAVGEEVFIEIPEKAIKVLEE